jgi:transcriptional regulator with XRE-family HTH domain
VGERERSWFRDRHTRRPGLGEAIQRRRGELGLSRRELAEAAGLSYPYLSELETGRKRGSPDSLRALAAALGVGQDDLWARAEELQSVEEHQALRMLDAPPPPAARVSSAPAPPQPGPPSPAALAGRIAEVIAGAAPDAAEAALLMALGELRVRQAARRPSAEPREP